MTPQKQTILSGEGKVGNCLQACVASLLDLPLDQVPHFSSYGERWYQHLYRFLEGRGYELDYIHGMKQEERWPSDYKGIDGYFIVGGESPRGAIGGHAVIYFEGEPYFDPHPSNDFILEEHQVYVIRKREPSGGK